jgi:hypothetical protein
MKKSIMNTNVFRQHKYFILVDEVTVCDLPEIKTEFEALKVQAEKFIAKMRKWNKLKCIWNEPNEENENEIQLSYKTWEEDK